MMQGNDSIVSSRPDDEVFRQIKLGKSRVSEIESQNLRPIYDQREHVQKFYSKQTYKKGIFRLECPLNFCVYE